LASEAGLLLGRWLDTDDEHNTAVVWAEHRRVLAILLFEILSLSSCCTRLSFNQAIPLSPQNASRTT